MCTAVIYRNKNIGVFGLGFNRDESRLRKDGTDLQIFEKGKFKAFFPLDGDFLGTWVGANTNKEIYCILNYYEKEPNRIKIESRGNLIKKILLNEIKFNELIIENINHYLPFQLLKISELQTEILIWDGVEINKEINSQNCFLVASSSFHGEKITGIRKKYFEENFSPKFKNILTNDEYIILLREYLKSHFPDRSTLSPCMHGEKSNTKSSTIISLEHNIISLFHINSQPCKFKEEIEKISIRI